METPLKPTIIERTDLPRELGTFEFEGYQYSDTEVSFIWVDMPPGGSVRLHRHPYKEIFIILEGVSMFVVGSATIDAHAGQIIIVPANAASIQQRYRYAAQASGYTRQQTVHNRMA